MSQDKGEAVSLSTPALVTQFDLLARAPGGVARLRALILALAVRGKLVPQDSGEDPARLEVVVEQVLQLIADGKVPKSRASEPLEDRSDEWELPGGWAAVRGSDVFIPRSGNSKLIKGKLFSEPGEGLCAGYSASGQDVWLSSFEYDGTAVILSAVGARCGKAFLARGKWSAIANTHIVWPIEGVVSGEYAMLLLNDESFWIRSGGAQPFLKVTETLQRTVLIPPLREQARIVARVDELMQLCDALEAKGRLEAQQHARLLETLLGTLTDSTTPEELAANWQRVAEHFDLLLDQPEAVDVLEQTVLQLAVRGVLVPQDPTERTPPADSNVLRRSGSDPIDEAELPYDVPSNWQWIRLGSVADLINGDRGTNYPNKSEYVATGLPFINTGHIEPDGTLSHESMHYLTRKKFESLRGGKTLPGDLVYCLRGATLGKTAIVEYPEGAIASSLVIIRLDQAIDRKYMYYYLTGPMGKSLVRRFDNGSAQPNLAANSVKRYVVPLPPAAEQRRIVARVEELRCLCADLRQRLAASQATQSRLAEALVEAATA